MNENTREAKAINGQETKTIEAGVTGLDEEQLAEVAGGVSWELRHISAGPTLAPGTRENPCLDGTGTPSARTAKEKFF